MYSRSGTNNGDDRGAAERAEAGNEKARLTGESADEQKKIRVLIVEDHPALRQSLRLYFEFKGYAVAATDGYAQALEAAADSPPDVIVCDRQLNDARDGIDVARALQSAYGSDIVFVSGTSMGELRAATSDLNVIAYLKKPVLPHRIEKAVRLAQEADNSNDSQ